MNPRIAASRQRLSRQNADAISSQREPNPVVRIGNTRADIQLSKGELTDRGEVSGIKIFNTESVGQVVSVIRPSGSQIGTFDDLSTQAIRRKEREEEGSKKKKNRKQYSTLFWLFIAINTAGGNLSITASDYEQYNDFVADGFTIRLSEALEKVVGNIKVEVRILFDKSIEITIDCRGAGATNSVSGTVECWRKTPRPDGKISVSRKIIYGIKNVNEISGVNLAKGNPGDRTEPATQQSNGYYRSIFNIFFTTGSFPANLVYKNIITAKSVPLAPDIQT